MARRLPVYLLVDSSGSMAGEPIHAVNVGINALLNSLRTDPFALDTVHLSLITFDREVKELIPLTSLDNAVFTDIELPRSGATHLGEALEFLVNKVAQDVVKTSEKVKGDFKPMLFLMTDGSPSDLMAYKEAIPQIKKSGFSEIVACAAGPKANTDYLKMLTDKVLLLESMNSSGFIQFFNWVSDSIASTNNSVGIGSNVSTFDLEPPPQEMKLI